MDWSSSGIRNTFEFEAIDNQNLESSYGFIEGIVGGTITELYRGDYRSTATLDVDDADIPENCLIRVWHTAELDGEVYREELGTFMQSDQPGDYIYGRYTGSINLYSTLLRCGTYKATGDKKVAKGTVLVDRFKYVAKDLCLGTPWVSPSIDSTKVSAKTRVWEADSTALSELHTIADSLGGYVTVDTHGRICLIPYVNPSSKQQSFEIPFGDDSLTLLGVGVSRPEIVNAVNATYKYNDTTYAIYAGVPTDHPWYWRRIGRWAVEVAPTDSLNLPENPTSQQIKDALKKAAETTLNEKADFSRTFSFSMLYMPLTTGDVGRFVYRDSDHDSGFDLKCLLVQRAIHLDAAMRVEMTMEELR